MTTEELTIATPEAIEILICGKSFYSAPSEALILIALEAATRDFDRASFDSFAKRYRLTVSIWDTPDLTKEKVTICTNEGVQGDWI